jgi:hypothetical protein
MYSPWQILWLVYSEINLMLPSMELHRRGAPVDAILSKACEQPIEIKSDLA